MARLLLTTAALVAAVVVFVLTALPSRQLILERPWDDGTLPGILHVHTNRSDGRSDPDTVAKAAARAGLRFLVFTDHGNGTRATDPPTYRSGVLCLDATEISTTGGHYLALDAATAPYPLGGEARDVVEDVRRLGGFGVAAHPDSPKSELRWRDWTPPLDGIEMINPDTSWRLRFANGGWVSRTRLLTGLLTYPVRPSETIASLLTDASASIADWTALTERRNVVALAGVDAHAKLELRNVDPGDNRYSLPIPGYESSFRSLSVHIRPDAPWTGNALADARSLMRSLRNGHLYSVVDGWATPPAFEFTAVQNGAVAYEGDEMTLAGPLTLRVRSNLPPGFAAAVWQSSVPLAPARREPSFTLTAEQPGVYRVEIRADAHPDGPPWILSNPIYIRSAQRPAPKPKPPRPVVDGGPLFNGRTTAGWITESDQTSVAVLEVAPKASGAELRLRYGLSGGSVTGQFAAAVVETAGGLAKYDRIRFDGRAERPMRVSVQVRADTNGVLERWQRSVYLDSEEREQVVPFDEMTPVSDAQSVHPPLSRVRSLMFVVDTTNTKPGSSGRVWLGNVRIETVQPEKASR